MKKVLALLLALVLVLSLVACGRDSGGEKQGNTATEIGVAETEKSSNKELKIGETCSIPDFADITLTKFDFSQEATSPGSDGINIRPNDGYVCANLYYDVKYTGKSKTFSDYFKPSALDYDNGYTFNLERFYYYDTGINSWLNTGDIQPLSPDFSCKACFFVPKEVENNKDKPLCILFNSYELTIRLRG